MTDLEKPKAASDGDVLDGASTGPLVFVSHDARDGQLAEAFSKLLKSVSAGMIKTFHSSDKKVTGGIDFGDEWYKRLMTKLHATSDVVCLFTERSLDRPWILYEAGVAKGRASTPVFGIALGVPLTRVATGPFYQFQNMEDSEGDLTKLVNQLARRVQNLELDADVVRQQVQAFKEAEASILKSLASSGGQAKSPSAEPDESPIAKLVEEMKSLPSRVAERLAEDGDPRRRRRMRHFHPMMFEELMHVSEGEDRDDPVAILMMASMVREDLPWLYELAMEVYRAAKTGKPEAIEREIRRLRRFSKLMMQGPFNEMLGGREAHMFAMEMPRIFERMLSIMLEKGKAQVKRRSPKPSPE